MKYCQHSHLRYGTNLSCGCLRRRYGAQHPCFKGGRFISGLRWHGIVQGAKIRDLDFSIDLKHAEKLLEQQNFRCALTGALIYTGLPKNTDQKTAILSLDRIDSSKGYIAGNVQWVTKRINIMKRDIPDEEFIAVCCQVADFQRQKAAATKPADLAIAA